ncbi:ABC transporter substrate-binding protein [Haladaptatus paucihalophilus]|uniref:Peptide/nickel transport system substrate-binding protein n=2 Tax=Haladaptatus paucihalophilus DX253 TaxID=797209 RepID=A0A1M7AXX8_HALPU|nr:ABC transporter substrate-binding protein [Haladaptatus paucihalophilus]SHL47610.1 peptide/nickel transport system substrate-binding protein [Haladaptatus paucihalophilus DX253]
MTDTDNLTRRRFLQATGGAASAVALAGCTGGGDDDNGNGDGNGDGNNSGGNKLQLINSTMTTLDPVKAADTASGTVIQQVFDSLMNYPNSEIAVEKQLAKGHEVSDDQKTYTFHLKEGVKFHNDKEVTAKDIVYSWRRLAESKNSRRQYFILSSIGVKHETTTKTYKDDEGEHELTVAKANSLALKAKDDYTLEMTLEKPFHATLEMLAYTSFAAIPEGIVGDIDGYDGEMKQSKFATKNPIGAGPFKFDHWKSDVSAEVTKFEDYHGDVPKVDGVHWKISSNSEEMYTYGVMNQNADMGYGSNFIPTSKYDPGKVSDTSTDDLGRTVGKYGPIQGNTFDYLGVSTINTYYMGFNTEAVPKPVRQAIAYAANQETIVEEVFKGRGAPAYHLTPPMIYPGGAKKYESHAKNKYPYSYDESDRDKAKQIMEDAGYNENNKFKFTFTVYKSSSTWPKLGKRLRAQLQAAHIEMEIQRTPFSTLLQQGRQGKLEAYSLGWVMDWPKPDNFLGLLYPPLTDTSKDSPQSYTNWSGTPAAKKATNAWDTIQNNTGPTDKEQTAREEAYIKMEEANWEDVTFLNMYHGLSERFSYEWVDAPKYGGADYSRQMYNKVKLSERK